MTYIDVERDLGTLTASDLGSKVPVPRGAGTYWIATVTEVRHTLDSTSSKPRTEIVLSHRTGDGKQVHGIYDRWPTASDTSVHVTVKK